MSGIVHAIQNGGVVVGLLVWLVFGAVGCAGMIALARFMDRRGYGDE